MPIAQAIADWRFAEGSTDWIVLGGLGDPVGIVEINWSKVLTLGNFCVIMGG
ncbi:MAG: hypothetical protein ACREHG_09350 [Candidatus Saccharimonadales bacterium]